MMSRRGHFECTVLAVFAILFISPFISAPCSRRIKMDRRRMGRASSRAASRLSELPMRVHDSNRMSTAYTTPRSDKPSMGKLSISKPLSQTSDRQKSFFGQRASGASMPRSSSIYGFGGPEKLKDTRPLHDKAFVQQCIRQLHEFLTELGYNVAPKTLQSPSTKEFVKLFEFIYRQLDPTFEMPSSKVEEEVPALLKSLRYPYVLSKSSMYSVGAPHTWPQALGALMWLIDNVKICTSLNQQDLLFSDFCEGSDNIDDSADYNRLFLDYTGTTYTKFMQGEDTYEEDDEAFISELKKMWRYDEELLVAMEQKHKMMMEEVERLEKENQKDRLQVKRTEQMRLQSDLHKLRDYSAQVEAFQANQEKKYSELDDELNRAAGNLESLKLEQGELQKVLRNQKYKPEDVQRINREKRELQQAIASQSQSLEHAQQSKWSEEIALAKVKEKAELKLSEYHKLARKLKLIPISAENACGHDFELRPFEYGPANVHLNSQTQMLLKKLTNDVEEDRSRLSNSKFSLEQSCEQAMSNIFDKENDLKQLREQIRKVDDRWDASRKEVEREDKQWAKEVEMVESNRNLLEEKINWGYEEAMQENKALKQQYHLVLLETNEQRRTVCNNLTSMFTTAADHLSATENCLKDLLSHSQHCYSKALEDDEKAVQGLKKMVEDFKLKVQKSFED
ncbi:kinetochore protein NDC80 homolog isoform X1 [Hippocampus comes]|uniref:kinetochore protein NDC80 homolog isoform X1 n=2 Tax=Hippocampus comes TaxID=109280 RepID=UPI00094EBE30|nr:PREDICTED: kinetochore protein NDC80 homolog isoform X1 [Hippocampus comes]